MGQPSTGSGAMTRRRRTFLSRMKSWLVKILLMMVGIWLAAILLFRVVPVPFSAVMAERQISSWLTGDFRYHAHSEWVPMDKISPSMGLAVIAAEDQKFPEHWGFDTVAIGQALDFNDRHAGRIRGASTLSQQTVKNLLLWDGRSWLRKGLEAGLTLGMEALWSKKRILTVYLNIAEFGDGIFGVQAAARHYFGKPASRLTARESALLAAVLPNPIRFNVNAPDQYVLRRQQWILKQMSQLGGERFMTQHLLQD